jgi:GNAT superfamily N-acetyltransferase
LPESSPAASSSRLTIENFRGDFDALASLTQASWAENSSQALLYSSEFLSSCFDYPAADFSLAPTIYDQGKPVAFVAGFPRRIKFKGVERNIILITFLTVSPEYKKKGLGIILWSELVKRARAAGFDGMVNYCVDGEPMNAMIVGSCKRLKLPVARIYSARYMSALLRDGIKETPQDDPHGSSKLQTVNLLLQLAVPLAATQPLARLWTRPEAEWQCVRRSGAVTAHYSDGSRTALLAGYIMAISNKERTRCLLIEDILWGALEMNERQTLLQHFLDKATSAGARMATVPLLGYADMEPFKKARFQGTRRVLHGYLTLWSGDTSDLGPEPLPSIYLDIF